MINIPHIDGTIWNPEQIVIDIVAELQRIDHADIFLDNEGSDLHFLGLGKILDYICAKLNYSPEQITIHTLNQLETVESYNIVKHPPLYIDSGKTFCRQNQLPEKQFAQICHFGIFISRSSWQRLWMSAWLHNKHSDKTLMTYHFDNGLDYHRPHLGFDRLCIELGTAPAVALCQDFLKKLPIKQDEIDSYPILTPAHFNIAKIYHKFFVEIVCETFLMGKTFYPTEKTWRPFMAMTPFMTIGPKDHLANLKKLGFKTFDKWWDESYDEDAGFENNKLSIQTIQKNCVQLSKMSCIEIESMYKDMMPTLIHNKQRFLDLSHNEFAKLWP
jgi:hypothetical protein